MKPKSPIFITFLPEARVVEASHGETLLETALRTGIEIPHSCGGNGTCGTCRVLIQVGLNKMPLRNEIEAEMANDRKFEANERLCCQNFAQEGLIIQVPERSSED